MVDDDMMETEFCRQKISADGCDLGSTDYDQFFAQSYNDGREDPSAQYVERRCTCSSGSHLPQSKNQRKNSSWEKYDTEKSCCQELRGHFLRRRPSLHCPGYDRISSYLSLLPSSSLSTLSLSKINLPFVRIFLFLLSAANRLVHFTSRIFYLWLKQSTPVVALCQIHDNARRKSAVGSIRFFNLPKNNAHFNSERTEQWDLCVKFDSSSSWRGKRKSSRHPVTLYAWILLATFLAVFSATTTAYELKPTTTMSRVTLAGQKARLPCELPLPADRPTLILWYKDQATKPFYSYDARDTATGRHKIHDNSDLATRSKFALEKEHSNDVKTTRLGYLEVDGVILTDAGNYTCRVDFMTSQTMMALLKLTVHEEIRGLEVFDVDGGIVSKVVGPYEQFKRVMLSCRAYGGYPAPVVQWMSGDVVLKTSTDDQYSTGPETTLTSTHGLHAQPMVSVMLHLAGLRREDNGREIKCIAFNTNLTQPRSRTLTIQVYLPPLEVKIEGLEQPMRAGKESMLLCRATGSRPPATLTWKLEGSTSGLTSLPAQSSLDQNTTLRRGRLLPTPDDNGRTLTCTASNPKVSEYKHSSSHTLEVHFAPQVEAKLAPALDPTNIKEGDDVYFECLIKANPPESRVIWLHEGKQLSTDLELGVLAQAKNLVLQKVNRRARGNYKCKVTNAIDTVTSNSTSLNVMFAPECSGQMNVTVSVTPTEEVNLKCLVDANPEEVRFVWKVNGTRGLKELEPSSYTSDGRSSTLVYKPSDHAIGSDQYGAVFCHGVNKLGPQKEPCMFTISPAGPPEELQSCVLKNQSATSLAVICQPGHDGGLEQHFIATVQDAESGELVANVSSKEPEFFIGNLASGRDYLVMVKATNKKGASEPYVLEGFALKVHEIKINNSSTDESSPLIAVFLGVVGVFVILFVVLAFVNRARGRRRRERAAQDTSNKLSTADDITPASPSTNASLDDVVEGIGGGGAAGGGGGGGGGEGGVDGGDPQNVEMKPPPELLQGTHLAPEATTQPMGSPGQVGTRSYSPGAAGQTGSLTRPHPLQSRPQPLHSVDLPHMTSSNHKYYTLKINCTRQNNESFV